jgi:phenylacetate-CoA ligase
LSAYHISAANAQSYITALKNHKIKSITGYPSALTALAEFVRDENLNAPVLQVIISNAEPLFEFQRNVIREVFKCPVINTYGLSELVCGAAECEQGSMHLWLEAGYIEIIDDENDELVAEHQVGRIIATGFMNADMPLIRYETGDRGSIRRGKCDCGRSFPCLEKIEGRIDDVIVTPDGRKVGRLDPVFKTDIPIVEAQIIQEEINNVRIKFIPGFGYHHDEILTRRVQERLGGMNIVLEPVENIPKGSNGKFKAVVSMIHKNDQI